MPLKAWTAVTDRFGAPRGEGLIHGGIDLALNDQPQSEVYAACDGVLLSSANNATYGTYVVVDCGDGWTTLYAHLSSIWAAVGQRVGAGATVLGISGSTGLSTGEHLHFEIRNNNVPLNPEAYLDFKIPPGTPLTRDEPPTPEAAATESAPAESEPSPAVIPTEPPAPTPTAVPIPLTGRNLAGVPDPGSAPGATPTPSPGLGDIPAEGAVLSGVASWKIPASGGAGIPVGARFALPLTDWTAVGDRFGAPRGPGLIHGGIDLALDDRPTAYVYAACDGFLLSSGEDDVYGHYAVIDCGDGWKTLYSHLSGIRVQIGQHLVKGATVLGISGSSGLSTADELHFEILYKNVPLNPEAYLDFKIPPGTPLTRPVPPRGNSVEAAGTATPAPASTSIAAAATANSTVTTAAMPLPTGTPTPACTSGCTGP